MRKGPKAKFQKPGWGQAYPPWLSDSLTYANIPLFTELSTINAQILICQIGFHEVISNLEQTHAVAEVRVARCREVEFSFPGIRTDSPTQWDLLRVGKTKKLLSDEKFEAPLMSIPGQLLNPRLPHSRK